MKRILKDIVAHTLTRNIAILFVQNHAMEKRFTKNVPAKSTNVLNVTTTME